MEVITSLSNALVKRVCKLKQKKYRAELGEFTVEGYRNVKDSALFSPQSVACVILSESAFGRFGAEFSAFDVSVVSDAVMQKLSDAQSSQGVISVNKIRRSEFPKGNCVLLDRVRDPGNVGTVLRTAVAAGYDVVLNDCCDVYSPKVVRSAMSAVLKCRMGENIDVSELKAAGYSVIVSDMGGADVFTAPRPVGKYCIVVGNEANGVDGRIVDHADAVLAIPQEGVESLNVAVAAGIMMFALRH